MSCLELELDLGLAYEEELVLPEEVRLAPPPRPAPGRPLTREEALLSLAAYEAKHGRKGVRKAYAALGDEVTFSRFVKYKVRPEPRGHAKQRQMGLPGLTRDAVEAGRSVFHRRGVKAPSELGGLLVSGFSNVKIGRDVRVGRLFRGYRIYTLTLEERATCPSSCHHWTTCYGNNMPWAKRVDHRDELALEQRLEAELRRLLSVRGREGVLVRLHALGDFFSESYVEFWGNMLAKHDNLAVYGYTARRSDDQIGGEILTQKRTWGRRFAIRWSDGGGDHDCTVSIRHGDPKPENAFVCPEQTGGVDACGRCGLCWSKTKNVAFIEH